MPHGGWQCGHVTGAEADTLFLAQDSLRGSSQEWREFYVQALVDHVVKGKSPVGEVDDARARWLLSRICDNGSLPGREELELVIGVLESADSASDLLRDAALEAILLAVKNGAGPTRCAGGLGAGSISPEEVELLGRIIATIPGAAGSMSYKQAQFLCAIKDVAQHGNNPKQWAFLFIQSIGQYLKAFDGDEPHTPAQQQEFESFMFNEGAAIAGFFERLHDGNFHEALQRDQSLKPLERGLLEFLYYDHQRSIEEQTAVKPQRRHAA